MATALIAPVVVVVAEDEFLLRVLTVEILSEEGFVVHEAEHAGQALTILQAAADVVHVLVTDVEMPGDLDGIALAHHVNAQWPHIGLLVTSARAEVSTDDLPNGARFLPKPYESDLLTKHVRELAHVD